MSGMSVGAIWQKEEGCLMGVWRSGGWTPLSVYMYVGLHVSLYERTMSLPNVFQSQSQIWRKEDGDGNHFLVTECH